MTDKPTIAVWFSCGAASAVAAALTLRGYSDRFNIRILNNPVLEEHADNRRFLADVQNWLKHPIETVTNSKYPIASAVEVWARRSFMSGPLGAPCTIELKKNARQQWEKENQASWHVLGFTADETKRHQNFVQSERENVIPVLIDAKMTKQDCIDFISGAGLTLPYVYSQGFPNANCIGCVKATSATYWNLVREKYPDTFYLRAIQSRSLGVRLVRLNGERIFLDELPPDAKGRPLKQLVMPECGIFCEEKPQ